MKCYGSAVALSTLIGLAAATACESNDCLVAIVASTITTRDGARDCSSYLVATVTPALSTITSTVTVHPTEYTTVVETDLFTTSQTTAVSTETEQITIQETVTASTETHLETVTVTPGLSRRGKARRDGACKPLPFPSYASACTSLENYISACSCVGVVPTTVTAAAPSTTVLETETLTVTSSILSTTSITEIDIIPVTASTTTTETQLIPVTETTSVTVTSTGSAAPVGTGVCGPYTGAFKAVSTDYGGQTLTIYADIDNDEMDGGINWSAAAPDNYIWAIDSNSRLYLPYGVTGSQYQFYAFMASSTAASTWPQMNIAYGNEDPSSFVTACVNSVTGRLELNAGGRTQIMWCGGQMWMSNNLGADVYTGPCTQMFPTIVPV